MPIDIPIHTAAPRNKPIPAKPTAAASSDSPRIEMKKTSTKSTIKMANRPMADVIDKETTWLNIGPLV